MGRQPQTNSPTFRYLEHKPSPKRKYRILSELSECNFHKYNIYKRELIFKHVLQVQGSSSSQQRGTDLNELSMQLGLKDGRRLPKTFMQAGDHIILRLVIVLF